MALNTGRFLRINLTAGKTTEEQVPESVAADFVGARGYGIRYLYDELAPGVDPLGEQNKLLLLSGPLAGTPAIAVSRWMACTKSPLTGGYARSVCGADFGAWLRFVDYDFLIIEGKADKPVYVHLTEDGCKILDAREIWGKDTKVTQAWLGEQHGQKTRTACIGPAGEKLVRYAAIVSDRRTAGRCGTGAVMGSKNLKAVAITAPRKVHLGDPETYDKLTKEQVKLIRDNNAFLHHKEWGTTTTQDITNDLGIYPASNFRYGRLVDYEKVVGEAYRKLRTGDMGCYSCPARCGKVHTVTAGPYAGAHSEGPEYETIWSFTGSVDSSDIEASIAADELCDDLGLDTISTGVSIGFAYELFEKGLISKSDTDGVELHFGDPAPMVELVRKIGLREGIGDLLAEGTMRAAAKIGQGSDLYAIHVKGMELPAYEPRGAKSQGYNYATASIGASHCYGYAAQDVFGAPIPRPTDRFSEEYADVVIFNQNGAATKETGIICLFAGNWGWQESHFGPMLAAARDMEQLADNDYLDKVGDRIINLERAFNLREGKGRRDDTLPRRILTEPLKTRGADGEGQVVSHQDEFLDKYYELRGWSREGVPTPQKLKDLGLGFAVKE
ncbi:aldehyde ferredoxin oxidoreductase family protein [bacterium]|nr:aldehyde ferredoxin oxidoreductase family protein [bacterium]